MSKTYKKYTLYAATFLVLLLGGFFLSTNILADETVFSKGFEFDPTQIPGGTGDIIDAGEGNYVGAQADAGVCEGSIMPPPEGNMRWMAPEANILAHAPIVHSFFWDSPDTPDDESAGSTPNINRTNASIPAYYGRRSLDGNLVSGSSSRAYKNHTLVFQSSVRDIEAPFLEITAPYVLDNVFYTGRSEVFDDDEDPTNPPPADFPELRPINDILEDLPKDRKKHQVTDPVDGGIDVEIEERPINFTTTLETWRYKNYAEKKATYAAVDAMVQNPEHASSGNRPLPSDPKGSVPSNPKILAHDGIIGPRGCNIGGWYEMLLYQARCIRWFKLNCICDYDKTFRKGSAEAWVLHRAGQEFEAIAPFKRRNGGWGVTTHIFSWPLGWRGTASPYYAPNATVGSKLWEKRGQPYVDPNTGETVQPSVYRGNYNIGYIDDGNHYGAPKYRGLSEAQVGDFMIYDETLKTKVLKRDASGDVIMNGLLAETEMVDARYRRHIAYVEEVHKDPESNAVDYVRVSEYNYGKNLDSCGNTDRWKKMTVRKIYKSPGEEVPEDRTCDNPDWLICYERNWDRIKLYRPSLDVDSYPVCKTKDEIDTIVSQMEDDGATADDIALARTYAMPQRFTDERLDLTPVPGGPVTTMTPRIKDVQDDEMTTDQILDSNAWKRYHLGKFDAQEVDLFLKRARGYCDPPFEKRTD